MKKTLIVLFIGLLTTTLSTAQESTLSKKFGFGFQLGQYQKDFGVGGQVTSPFFLHQHLAIRAKANIMWNEHPQDGSVTWSQYSNLSIGVVGMAGEIANIIRLYGEGGVLFIFPNANFSSSSTELGGYGLFGFEFFISNNFNYYIEIGGVGTGAVADQVLTNPIYSNGLLIQTGFRAQL